MAEPQSPQAELNRILTNPGLSDALNGLKKDVFLSFKCHDIAIVQSFDPDDQTIEATIAYKKTYLVRNNDGTYTLQNFEYPILIDVPVIFMGNKTLGLTFPVTKGDECLVLYNDRDIDNWFQSGQVNAPSSNRAHSISDGIALIGLRSSQNIISDFDEARVLLRNGEVGMGVSSSKATIYNSTRNLNTVLQQLISDIQNIVTIPAAVGLPLTLNPASIAALAADAAALGELLE